MTRGPNYSMQFLFEFCIVQYILVHGRMTTIPSFLACKCGHASHDNPPYLSGTLSMQQFFKKRCMKYYIFHGSFALTHGPNYGMPFLFEFCRGQYILVHGSLMAIPSFMACKYGHAFRDIIAKCPYARTSMSMAAHGKNYFSPKSHVAW